VQQTPIEVNQTFPYFAYGSNMNFDQMKQRVGSLRDQPRHATLPGYQLVFNKLSKKRRHNVANIVHTGNNSDVVEGGLFYLTKAQLEQLDKKEGLVKADGTRLDTDPKYEGYYRVLVKLHNNLNVYTYIATFINPEKVPSIKYVKLFLDGWTNNIISKAYFEELLEINVKEGGKLKDHVNVEDYAPPRNLPAISKPVVSINKEPKQVMQQFTDEVSTKYGEAIPAKAELAVNLREHLLNKLRAQLLSDENPDAVADRLTRRYDILRVMAGNCPEIENEIHQIVFDFEDVLLQAIREYIGINNNPKKINAVLDLIKKSHSQDPLLKKLSALFNEVRKFTGFRNSGVSPDKYLNGLLVRITRKLSDFPIGILKNILKMVFFSFRSHQIGDQKILIRKLEALSVKKLIPIIDQCYNQEFPEVFARVQQNVAKLIPKIDDGGAHDILLAASRGHKRYLDGCFYKHSTRRKNWQHDPNVYRLPYNGWRNAVTGELYIDGSVPLVDEIPEDHQIRFLTLGIQTFQPTKKIFKRLYPDISLDLTIRNFNKIVEIFVAACDYGNTEILIPLIRFFEKEGFARYDSNIDKITLRENPFLFPSHLEDLLLQSAYQAGSVQFVNIFIDYFGAKPLKLIDNAIGIKKYGSRKMLLLDMVKQFVNENPGSKLAANLDDALRNDKPYDIPVFNTRSLEFFEESSVLRKLCRLAEPFLVLEQDLKKTNIR